jgi:hypothetical protein
MQRRSVPPMPLLKSEVEVAEKKKHPGFKKVQAEIAQKQGISKENGR